MVAPNARPVGNNPLDSRPPANRSPLRIRAEFPYCVREVDNTWIELTDGCRLAARLWIPETAAAAPVPAVLEYLPYRKDDVTAWQDSTRHRYFAGSGYAGVRVDLRGSGDSDGILLGEYMKQEQDDALEVIAWIAEQPWCSGEVGMIGYSWGGFNALQVAARRPDALKAVISVCSTDDRYLDDCHYMGGCLLAADMLKWAETMRAFNALPPDPRFVGERWREMWRDRLERTPHLVEEWLKHQRRDDFWKQGSVAEDYSAIDCPVFLAGGWADAYTNAIPRLLEGLVSPCKAVIGPWAHMLPERGVPGPPIGFLQECVHWWDRWLKSEPNAVDDWPALRVWMQEPAPPATFYAERPGRWIAEKAWPPTSVTMREFAFSADGSLELSDVDAASGGAGAARGAGELVEIVGSEVCGETQGAWCANGLPDELPGDQRPDDKRSLCFDTAPLEERLELLGFPEAALDLEVDRPAALVALWLCAVAPDGRSTLISRGQLNLAHRDGHEHPASLAPGRRYLVRIRLDALGQAVEVGQRLRLAVSPTNWPMAWPSPERVTLRVHPAGCRLLLPMRDLVADASAPGFGDAEIAEPIVLEPTGRSTRERRVRTAERRHTIEDHEVRTAGIGSTRTTLAENNRDSWSIVEGDPLSARASSDRDVALDRPGWSIRVSATAEMTCDEAAYFVVDVLEAFDGDARVFRRETSIRVPRDF
jgi:putative CocE/NonD family hydrolase